MTGAGAEGDEQQATAATRALCVITSVSIIFTGRGNFRNSKAELILRPKFGENSTDGPDGVMFILAIIFRQESNSGQLLHAHLAINSQYFDISDIAQLPKHG